MDPSMTPEAPSTEESCNFPVQTLTPHAHDSHDDPDAHFVFKDEECVICYDREEYDPEAPIRGPEAQGFCITKCAPVTHKFHIRCLMKWMERTFTCPMCRQHINIIELIDDYGYDMLGRRQRNESEDSGNSKRAHHDM